MVAEHVIGGRLPLWNPYIFAGEPLLANPQSAVFYPGSILFLIFGIPFAFNWFSQLHFLLAGIFFFLYLSSLGFKNTASFVGSVCFTFSSFLVYKVPSGHPVALSGYIWLPLVMLGADRVRKNVAVAVYDIIFLATVLTLQFVSGHTFPLYISLVYLFIHCAYYRFVALPRLLWCGGVMLGVSAVQFLPTFELSRVSETAMWSVLTASYSLPFKNLVNILMPNFYGNIIDGTYVYPLNPSFFFERHAVYFGTIPALLSAGGVFYALKERRYFFPLLAAVGLVLSFGFYTPVYRFLYHVLPGIGYLRVPSRFYFLVVAAGAACAGIGWQRLFDGKSYALLKIALCFLIVAELMWWEKKYIYADDIANYRRKSPIAALANPLYRLITQPERIPSNKAMLYHEFNVNGYEAVFLRDFTRYLGLQEKQVFGTTGLARTDLTSPLARGLAAATLISVDPVAGMPLVSATSGGLKVYAFDNPLPRIFFPKTVKVIPDRDVYEQIAYLQQTVKSPAEEIVVARQPPIAADPAGSGGRVVSYSIGSDRITAEVVMPRAGPVVFSEIAYSGWKVFAGGKQVPLVRGNKALRTVFLPAGKYVGNDRIFMVFQPVTLFMGIWFTIAALVSMGVVLLYLHKYSYLRWIPK
jgi:hypothetical protein